MSDRRIILITGGQRSGKSTKAEQLALSLSDNPVYVATAHIWDEEFRQRVVRHQERRGPQWTNIEEELYLRRHDLTGRVVVVDCVTLWLTNFFYRLESDIEESLEAAKKEFDAFTAHNATYIFVTNEIAVATIITPLLVDNKLHVRLSTLAEANTGLLEIFFRKEINSQ